MARPEVDYPIKVTIPAAVRQDRLSIVLRPLLGIPLFVVGLALEAVAATVIVIPWAVIVTAGRYPPRLRNLAIAALNWHSRARAYSGLLTGEFPPLSLGDHPAYPVQLEVEPEVLPHKRWTVLFRPVLAVPHLLMLVLLELAGFVFLLAGRAFATFQGSVPLPIHAVLARIGTHAMRFRGYALLLTDEYPPLRLR